MQFTKIVIAVSTAIIIVGCESNGNIKKSEIGAYSGAIIGGLIGSRFGEGAGRAVATLLGVAAGTYIGHQFGDWLDKNDQQDVATVGGGALDNTRDGQTMTFKNTDTGLLVKATPTSSKTVTRDVQVLKLRTVESRRLDIIGDVFVAKKSSKLRAGPSVNTSVVGGLRAGETFEAIGRVTDAEYKDHSWIAVGKRGGRLVGYVWEPLVASKSTAPGQSRSVLATSTAIDEINNEKLSEPVDLDALDIRLSEQSEGYDLDELFEKETITASTQCRDVDVSVEKGEHNGDSSFSACKTPNGAWEII